MVFRLVRQTLVACLCLGGLSSSQASADELEWTHYGLRPLAMGNAFVGVADDYNALFYNPAGLARLTEWNAELLNPAFEISAATVSFISDLSDLASGSAGDTDAVLNILENNTGKSHHFALGLTPHFVMRNFGIGLGMRLNTTMSVHREISTELDFGPRAILPIQFATNIVEGLSIGGGIKLVARGGVDREFSINDLQVFQSSSSSDEPTADSPDEGTATTEAGPSIDDFVIGGTGVGADFGLLFTPIKTWEPTLGISITDVGGTPYEKANIGGEALGTPDLRLPSVNTGISIKPWRQGAMYVMASADAHAINQPIHYSKKFNLGVEWGYGKIIKVQSGLHQGELSGGFEFDVFLFSCRFVTYAEQLGPVAGMHDDLSDRRYAMQLKLLF